jgi:hypothetical protein
MKGRRLYRIIGRNRISYLQQGGIVPSGMNPAFMPYIPFKPVVVQPISAAEIPLRPSLEKPSFEVKLENGIPIAKTYGHYMVSDIISNIESVYAAVQSGVLDANKAQVMMNSLVNQLGDFVNKYNTSLLQQEEEQLKKLRGEGKEGPLFDGKKIVGSVSGIVSAAGKPYDQATDFERAYLDFNHKVGTTVISRSVSYTEPTDAYVNLANAIYSGLGFFGQGAAGTDVSPYQSPLDGAIMYTTKSGRSHSKSNRENVKAGLDAVSKVVADPTVLAFLYREGNDRAEQYFKSRGFTSSVDVLADAESFSTGVTLGSIREKEAELKEKLKSEKNEENKKQISEEIKKLEAQEREVRKKFASYQEKVKKIHQVLVEEMNGADIPNIEKYIKAALSSGEDIFDEKGNMSEDKKKSFMNMVYAYSIYDVLEPAQFRDKSVLDRVGLYNNLSNASEPDSAAFQVRKSIAERAGIDEKYLAKAAAHLKEGNSMLVYAFGIDNRDLFDKRMADVKLINDSEVYASIGLSGAGGGNNKKDEFMRDLLYLLVNDDRTLYERAKELGIPVELTMEGTNDITSGDKTIGTFTERQAVVNVNNDVPPPPILTSNEKGYNDPDKYYKEPDFMVPPQLIIKASVKKKDGKSVVRYIPLYLERDLDISSLSKNGKITPTGGLIGRSVIIERDGKTYRKGAAYQAASLKIEEFEVFDDGKVNIKINGEQYSASVPESNGYRAFLKANSSVFIPYLDDPDFEGEASVYVLNPAFKSDFATNENAPQRQLSTVGFRALGGEIHSSDSYVKSLIDSIFE